MKNITLFFICILLPLGCATTNDIRILDEDVRRKNLELSRAVKEIESLKKEIDILYKLVDITPIINEQTAITSTLDQQAFFLAKHSLEFEQIHSTINDLQGRIKRIEDAYAKPPSTPPSSPRPLSDSPYKGFIKSTLSSPSSSSNSLRYKPTLKIPILTPPATR
jgi:hypothetical protein